MDSTPTPDRLPFPIDDIICNVCRHIVNRAVEAPCCWQLFCAECICTWLDTANSWPCCRKVLYASKLVALHPRVAGILSQVCVKCEFAESVDKLHCTEWIPLKSPKLHVSQSCKIRPGAAPHSPLKRVVTPSSSLKETLEASPSKLRGDYARKVSAHMALAQEERGEILLPTGGAPQIWHRVTRGRTETPSDRT